MMRFDLFKSIGFGLILCTLNVEAFSACLDHYQVGAAQSDITGPIAEVPLNGYGDFQHRAEGLHMRIRSRAFVIESPCEQRTVALVVNELGMIFPNIRQEVLARLERKLPGVFNESNLMLSATHTHAAHGGYGHYNLYNVTSFGFQKDSWEAIVEGTMEAVENAYRFRRSAQLFLNQGQLQGAGWNRSKLAYEKNPQIERQRYESDVDTQMVVLNFKDLDGRPIGSLNWFAVHPVSLPMENRLISGDNKGLAAYFVEKAFGTTYLPASNEFIAGFLQSNSGDVSPYPITSNNESPVDYWARLEQSAAAQASEVIKQMKSDGQQLTTGLDHLSQNVNLHGYTVEPPFSGEKTAKTCDGALGVAFAAGTENGQPFPFFKEGTVYGVQWPKITLMPNEQACHQEKVVLLPTGKWRDWTPNTLPYQVIRLGELAIIGAPFELTTMAGRRLRELMLKTLAPIGVKSVVITALANHYAHYVTTPEEYAAQSYEGGSTLFGPLTFGAYSQIFHRIGAAMVSGQDLDPGPTLPKLRPKILPFNPGVIFDTTPNDEPFATVAREPYTHYKSGDLISVAFWGAHPKNDLKRNQSFLRIERLDDDKQWRPILYDWDHETRLTWRRVGLAHSEIEITWQSSKLTPGGTYRVCHEGAFKAWIGKTYPYRGCTSEFYLQAEQI